MGIQDDRKALIKVKTESKAEKMYNEYMQTTGPVD